MGRSESTNIELSSGDTLYVEGDESDSIYVLGQGSLEMMRDAETFGQVDRRGDPLGFAESALGIPRQTTLRAADRSRLKKYDLVGDDIYDWLEGHPLTGFRVLRNNARLLDFLNRDNKESFDRFREARNTFEFFLSPFMDLLSSLPSDNSPDGSERIQKVRKLLENSFVGGFTRNYRSIINTTGRSVKQAPSDLSVPEEIQENFSSSSIICEEGTEEDCFYLLLEGTLSVHKEGQRVATIDEPGSIFGEMSALLSGQRTATIRADSESRVAAFPREKLREIFEESPGLGRTILKTFLKRLQRSVTLHDNLSEFLDQLRQIRNAGELPGEERQRLLRAVKAIDESKTSDGLEEPVRRLKEFLREGFGTS